MCVLHRTARGVCCTAPHGVCPVAPHSGTHSTAMCTFCGTALCVLCRAAWCVLRCNSRCRTQHCFVRATLHRAMCILLCTAPCVRCTVVLNCSALRRALLCHAALPCACSAAPCCVVQCTTLRGLCGTAARVRRCTALCCAALSARCTALCALCCTAMCCAPHCTKCIVLRTALHRVYCAAHYYICCAARHSACQLHRTVCVGCCLALFLWCALHCVAHGTAP